MLLPTLYSRTATGAIQTWTIEVDGSAFRTISGQIDGRKTTSEWTRCEPKNVGRSNERTAEQQALFEAQAKWDKKAKTGYFEDINEVDNMSYIEPMLAKLFSDYKDKINWQEGVIVQTKFNGLRCIATRKGLFSRKGEQYHSVPHIKGSLTKFFETYPDAVLDGELFNYDLRQQLNKISSLCRKQSHKITPEDLVESEKTVRYYVYDGYGILFDHTTGYNMRKAAIDKILPPFSAYCRHVQDWHVFDIKVLETVYQEHIDEGHEGIIVRILGKPYEHKRSRYLLKYKPTDDAEFIITSVESGKGNWTGMAKRIGLKTLDGKTFDAAFKGSMGEAAKMLAEKDSYIGQTARIFFNGYTGLGTPNSAQFDYNNWEVGDK